MFKITEYVPANEIWENAKTFIDKGYKSGLVRGYNIELLTKENETFWLSCEYIHEDPEVHFNNDYYQFLYCDRSWVPTGRISFRGYGREDYDLDARETFIIPVEV